MCDQSDFMLNEQENNLEDAKDIEFHSDPMIMNEITNFEHINDNAGSLTVNNINEEAELSLNNTTASTNTTDMLSSTLTTVSAQKSLNELNHTEREKSVFLIFIFCIKFLAIKTFIFI